MYIYEIEQIRRHLEYKTVEIPLDSKNTPFRCKRMKADFFGLEDIVRRELKEETPISP